MIVAELILDHFAHQQNRKFVIKFILRNHYLVITYSRGMGMYYKYTASFLSKSQQTNLKSLIQFKIIYS